MGKTVTLFHPDLDPIAVPAKAAHLYERCGWSTNPTAPPPPEVSVTEDDDEIDFDID